MKDKKETYGKTLEEIRKENLEAATPHEAKTKMVTSDASAEAQSASKK